MRNVNEVKSARKSKTGGCQLSARMLAIAGAAAMGVCLAATSGQAATITWQTPNTTFTTNSVLDTIPGEYSGASLKQSVYFGTDSATYTVSTSLPQTIPFTHGSATTSGPSGSGTGLFYSGTQKLTPYSPTTDSTFNNVLENDGWGYTGKSSTTLTLQIGGLTTGTNYAIQLFAYDPRSTSSTRSEKFADTAGAIGSNSASFSTASAASVIGTFTANAATQDVYAWMTTPNTTAWNTTVSAFTLYTTPAPEPASLGLLGAGAIGLLLLKKRKVA